MIQVLPELEGGDQLTYEPTIFRSGTRVGRELLSAGGLPAPYFPDESMYPVGKTYEEQRQEHARAIRPNLPVPYIPYERPYELEPATAVPTLRTESILPPDYDEPGALEQLGELLNPFTGPGVSPANVYGFFAEDVPEAAGETVEFAKEAGSAALDLAPLVLMGVMMMVMRQVKQ